MMICGQTNLWKRQFVAWSIRRQDNSWTRKCRRQVEVNKWPSIWFVVYFSPRTKQLSWCIVCTQGSLY